MSSKNIFHFYMKYIIWYGRKSEFMGRLGKRNLLYEKSGKFLGSDRTQTVFLIHFYIAVNAYTPNDLHLSCLRSEPWH